MKIKSKVLSIVWDYLCIAFGTALYVWAWTSFMIPRGMSAGGLTGACSVIQMATGIPVGLSYPIINATLIILATIIMGKGFGFRTIFAIIVASVLFEVLPKFPILESLPGKPLYVKEDFMIPVICGLLESVGIGLIFAKGGSTGGTDIIALIINKFWPISAGMVYLFCDLAIIASMLIIPGKTLQDMLYGYIAMITFSVGVDYVMMGRKSSVQVLIFSEKYEEIADFILHKLNRGVTALDAEGWYTRTEKKVLLVLVRRTQLHSVTSAVKALDPKAFVSVSPANDVFGEGFDEIKAGIEKRRKKKENAISA